MERDGKSSLLAVAGLASGVLLVLPTQAAAQFNIEGLIRGAIQQQGCCYGGGYQYRGGGSGYTGRRTTTKSQNNNDDSAPVDKTKEKDATQVESPNNGVVGRQQEPSGPAPSASRSVESSSPTRQTSAASNSDDQPSFTPSR